MNSAPQPNADPDPNAIVAFDGVSKWYGNVIGLNKLSIAIHRGVTGLLGPNGAGKSTFLQLATGQLRPSQGDVRVLGHRPWSNAALNRHIGLCPEQDAFFEWMSGRQFLVTCARLAGLGRDADRAAEHALDQVGMTEHARRAIKGYSKGMRQRTKLAQALIHNPDVLFLDEPLTGTDPVARRDLMDAMIRLADAGKSVIFSSHVLHEVQAVTSRIVLLNRGRLVAEGEIRQIRDLIDKHPHRIMIRSGDDRDLAARLLRADDVRGIEFPGDGDEAGFVMLTDRPDAFYARLPALASEGAATIEQLYSEDDNLEAVFKYLVNS
jgi:ABC-2 type transport system ATP-binding protein